jgi:hypothetical protein
MNSDHNQRQVRDEAPARDAKGGGQQAQTAVEKDGFGIGTVKRGVTSQEDRQMSRCAWSIFGALISGALAIGSMASEALAQGTTDDRVAPPQSNPYGSSYGEWGARWWQWAYSFTADTYPPNQSGPVDLSLHQSGQVWFLAGTSGGVPVTRTGTIPSGTALFFPIVNYINDYPCPDPSFQPKTGQSLEEFLTDGAKAVIAATTELEVVIDGRPLEDPFDYRATSRLFTFTADPSLITLDPCVTGSEQYGVADGYWVMLRPLSVGAHTISIHGRQDFEDFSIVVDATYHLQVVPKGSERSGMWPGARSGASWWSGRPVRSRTWRSRPTADRPPSSKPGVEPGRS